MELPPVITDSVYNETVDSVCYVITLKTDDILEGNETIRLELSSTESFVTFTRAIATLTIFDSVSISLVCVSH